MRHIDTFFKGYRRETFIEDARILRTKAGEKRLKLAMRIPLSGDQLVGMPTWVSAPYTTIAKPENAVGHFASTMELDPMRLHVFMLPEAQKEAIDFESVRMCKFRIEQETKEEHPALALHFAAYLPRTGRYLKFADDNFCSSLFILFEAMQPELLDTNPNVKADSAPVSTSLPPGDRDDDEEDDEEEKDEEKEYRMTEKIEHNPMDPEFEIGPSPAVAAARKGTRGNKRNASSNNVH
jgi:hypothetical protein